MMRCNMKQWGIILMVCSLLNSTSPAMQAESKAEPSDVQILTELQIFRVTGSLSGDTTLTEDIWAGTEKAGAERIKALTLFTAAKLKIGEDTLIAAQKNWSWNGKSAGMDKTPSFEHMKLLHSPRAMINSGETAEINIISQQPLEYFERRSGDMFELKRKVEETGLKISITAEEESSGKIHLTEIKFSLRSVGERKPIRGVSLPVGEPIINDQEITADLRLTPGKYYGLMLHPSEGQGLLIVRLRVKSLEPVSDSTESSKQ